MAEDYPEIYVGGIMDEDNEEFHLDDVDTPDDNIDQMLREINQNRGLLEATENSIVDWVTTIHLNGDEVGEDLYRLFCEVWDRVTK